MLAQFLRFALVGGAATLAHIGGALAAGAFALPPLIANAIGFAVAVLVSYFGHAFFTFRLRPQHRKHFPRHFSVALAGLGLSSALVWALHIRLGVDFALAVLAASTLVPLATFVAQRFWTFRPEPPPPFGQKPQPLHSPQILSQKRYQHNDRS